MQSVATNPRTVVKSCHASSKTFTAADIGTWWPTRYPDGKVITTAPTFTQVKELLWSEIRKNVDELRSIIPTLPQANQVSWKIGPQRYGLGFSTDRGVRFQGFHGRVLIILDEAAGVRPDIWPAIEGIRAGGDVRVLAIGNPSSPSGPFYDAFTVNRSLWKTFTINAFHTPNFVDEEYDLLRKHRESLDPADRLLREALDGEELPPHHNAECLGLGCARPHITLADLLAMRNSERLAYSPRPYLVTRAWVLEKYDEWGEGSPLWDTKVLGRFPSEGPDQLLGLAYLEAAENREIKPRADWELEVGIDVAGPGENETVVTVRRGPNIEFIKGWALPDPRGIAVETLEPWHDELKARGKLKIDSAGIGYYFAKHFEDLGFPVQYVNVGLEPTNKEKHANLKAELYWGLRMRVRDGDISLLPAKNHPDVSRATIDKTISQLASIKYGHTERNQVKIEKKEDAVKRGVTSPDYAESVMLAFARSTDPGMIGFYEQELARLRAEREIESDD